MIDTTPKPTNMKPSASIIERIALHIQKDCETVKDIAVFLCLSLSTVYFWVRRIRHGGPEATSYKKRGRPIGSGKKLTPEQEMTIQELITEGHQPSEYNINYSTWTMKAIAQLIFIQFEIKIAERTVGDYLKNWKFTSQTPVKQSYQRDPEKAAEWINITFKAIRKLAENLKATIYFADESCVQTDSFNGKSFSPKGIKPVIKTIGTRLKLNVISAITTSGILRYMTYQGSMNGLLFIEFMKKLIKSAHGSIVFLVVDNLKTHHSKMVAKFLEEHKDEIQIFYLPPYCPDLNPDEYFNNIYKQKVHSKPPVRTKDELLKQVGSILKSLQNYPYLIQRIFLKDEIQYVLK
jgi:transposase